MTGNHVRRSAAEIVEPRTRSPDVWYLRAFLTPIAYREAKMRTDSVRHAYATAIAILLAGLGTAASSSRAYLCGKRQHALEGSGGARHRQRLSLERHK